MAAFVSLLLATATLACGGARLPPNVPPTPTSVTAAQPGGNAFDPHAAALERLLLEPWGMRRAARKHLRVPLPDIRKWSGTEFALVDELFALRYGDDYHALFASFLHDAPRRRAPSAERCYRRHMRWMLARLSSFGVELSESEVRYSRWNDRNVVVGKAEAELDYGIGESRISAAWAVYPAYSDACLVMGIAVFHRGRPRLARAVRDRWVAEGPPELEVVLSARPPLPAQ